MIIGLIKLINKSLNIPIKFQQQSSIFCFLINTKQITAYLFDIDRHSILVFNFEPRPIIDNLTQRMLYFEHIFILFVIFDVLIICQSSFDIIDQILLFLDWCCCHFINYDEYILQNVDDWLVCWGYDVRYLIL